MRIIYQMATNEELEYLELRHWLKQILEREMEKELGTANPSRRDITSALLENNHISIFGPLQPIFFPRVIRESKSLLENPNLAASFWESNHADHLSRVTNWVKTKVEMFKRKRDFEMFRRKRDFLLYDDPMVLTPTENVPQRKSASPNSDFRIGTTRKNEKEIVMTCLFLPSDFFFEILSWLPVESLLRLKCVCKVWCSIIEDPMFINTHMNRAPYTTGLCSRENAGFTILKLWQGLQLERCNSTKAYRLRNPATRQVLDLPCPCEPTGICANMCYIPATNDLKLVYMDYSEKETNMYIISYYVVRIGSDVIWKRLDSPSLCEDRKVWPTTVVVGTVFSSVSKRLTGDYVMDCIDLENDDQKIISTTIPRCFFPEWRNVSLLGWFGKLSLAYIEQEKLNVWILENYKKSQWADRKLIIPLTFMKDYPCMRRENIGPCSVEGSRVLWYFRKRDHHAVFSFDIESKKVKFHAASSTRMNLCHYQPNLLHFKGMRQESANVEIFHCGDAEDLFLLNSGLLEE